MRQRNKETCAAPYYVEIQTIKITAKGGQRCTRRQKEFGNLPAAVQWLRQRGWGPSPTSYILRHPDLTKPLGGQTATIWHLLDWDNGIDTYKARHGTLGAAQLMGAFRG